MKHAESNPTPRESGVPRTLTISLPPALFAKLRTASKTLELSQSAFARKAIEGLVGHVTLATLAAEALVNSERTPAPAPEAPADPTP